MPIVRITIIVIVEIMMIILMLVMMIIKTIKMLIIMLNHFHFADHLRAVPAGDLGMRRRSK